MSEGVPSPPPPPLLPESQDDLLEQCTTFLCEKTVVPFVCIYSEEEEEKAKPRRLCKIMKDGSACKLMYVLARELCTETILDAERCALIAYMHLKCKDITETTKSYENTEYENFMDCIQRFVKYSKHPLFFIIWQDPSGDILSYLHQKECKHHRLFWYNYIITCQENNGKLDISNLSKKITNALPPADLDECENMDLGEDDDDSVKNLFEEEKEKTCLEVFPDFEKRVEELLKIPKK